MTREERNTEYRSQNTEVRSCRSSGGQEVGQEVRSRKSELVEGVRSLGAAQRSVFALAGALVPRGQPKSATVAGKLLH
jgi:hypothetical protein